MSESQMFSVKWFEKGNFESILFFQATWKTPPHEKGSNGQLMQGQKNRHT